MINLDTTLEDKEFKESFHNKIKNFFEDLIINDNIKPVLVEIDKVEFIIENGNYKRDKNGKIIKNITKGVSLISKEEWEKENGKFKKGGDFNYSLLSHLLIEDCLTQRKYNLGIESLIFPSIISSKSTEKEFFYLEKINNKFDLQKLKKNQRRIIVPEEMISARITASYELDIIFKEDLGRYLGARGCVTEIRGKLKIEGERDELIEKVYNIIKN